MVSNRSFQLLFVIFIGTAIISQTVNARYIIDDFESGVPVHLSVDQYDDSDNFYERGLPVPSGKREIYIFNCYNPTGTVTKLDIDSTLGDDALYVSGAKVDQDQRGSSVAIWYRDFFSDISLDTTSLGDRFYVIFNDDPGTDVSMSISLQSKSSTISGPGRWNLNGSGYYEIPFSVYTDHFPDFDLTNITGFGLHVSFKGSQQDVAITEWGIVPEPCSLILLGLGGILFRCRR
jgi:hypothetical protein